MLDVVLTKVFSQIAIQRNMSQYSELVNIGRKIKTLTNALHNKK